MILPQCLCDPSRAPGRRQLTFPHEMRQEKMTMTSTMGRNCSWSRKLLFHYTTHTSKWSTFSHQQIHTRRSRNCSPHILERVFPRLKLDVSNCILDLCDKLGLPTDPVIFLSHSRPRFRANKQPGLLGWRSPLSVTLATKPAFNLPPLHLV